jgi:hypothetical protein
MLPPIRRVWATKRDILTLAQKSTAVLISVQILSLNSRCDAAFFARKLAEPGNPLSYGFAGAGSSLSPSGQIAGYARVSSGSVLPIDVAVVWDDSGVYRYLPVVGQYQQAYANGFGSGEVPVGAIRFDSTDVIHPAIWDRADGSARILPTVEQFGQAVQGVGQYIAGFSLLSTHVEACYWDNDGVHRVTGMEDRASQGFSINSSGWYVGTTTHPTQGRAGFFGRGGTATLLVHPDFPNTLAFDINESNVIAGEYRPRVPIQQQRAMAVRGGVMQDLGLLAPFSAATAYAVNDDGTIVGAASHYGGDVARALIWVPGANSPLDLNDFVDINGVTLIRAMDINDAGQILAEGLHDGGGWSYYLLSPIPEPAGLFFAAAGALLLRRRRPAASACTT